jgi:hypothetical protein
LNGGLRAVYFYPQSTLLSWRILRVQLDMIDKITRFGTGIMLGAFAVIILTTTFSTADWVATLGKVMYWVIICIALLSLCVWGVRSRISGRKEKESGR